MRGNQAVAMIAAPRMAATAAGHDQEGPADQAAIGAVVHVPEDQERAQGGQVHDPEEDRELVQAVPAHDPEDREPVQEDQVHGPARVPVVMIAATRAPRIAVHSRTVPLRLPCRRRCALNFCPKRMARAALPARSNRAAARTHFSARVDYS